MRTVTGKILSSTPVPISKAASILSKFVSADTGASQAVNAYLRRATAAFDELARLHSKSDRRKHNRNKPDAAAAAVDATEEVTARSGELSQEPSQEPSHEIGRTEEKKKKKKKKKEKEREREIGESDSDGFGVKEVRREKLVILEKKKKEKISDFGALSNSITVEKTEISDNEEQSDLVEKTERKKHKKKEKSTDFGALSNSINVEKTEISVKEEQSDLVEEIERKKHKKKKVNGVEVEMREGDGKAEIEEKKEEEKKKKKRKNREEGSEERSSKKKRRRDGE